MTKSMRIMLASLAILFGSIFLYKAIIKLLTKRAIMNQPHLITVSTATVRHSMWLPKLSASGSLRAIRGVNVTTELAGMVQTIYFKSGTIVKKNDKLIQLNADSDIAQLQAIEANAALANITLLRDKAQYKIHAISKQTLDNDDANLKNLTAQVAQQKAIIAKKTIRAPFAGRLGINTINPGQYINPGDSIVTLQTLQPIYADFYIPQQQLASLQIGQKITVNSNSFPKQTFTGIITTINPLVDVNTRNIEVEATITNLDHKLIPGMFVNIDIITGKPASFLTVPQMAITFNPYGDLVYLVRQSSVQQATKQSQKTLALTVIQHFVTTGETRGEQIKILQGLKEGDVIVTSGQLKLKNGSQIVINNTIKVPDHPTSNITNNH